MTSTPPATKTVVRMAPQRWVERYDPLLQPGLGDVRRLRRSLELLQGRPRCFPGRLYHLRHGLLCRLLERLADHRLARIFHQ